MALESLSPTGPGPRRRRIESGSRSSNARARIMRGPAAKSERWTTPREQSGRGGSTDWQQATARRRWACENWQSVSLFFFRQPGPVGYAVRFARRRGGPASAWLVGGLWMRAAHGPTAAPAAEGTHTHPPRSHLPSPSLPCHSCHCDLGLERLHGTARSAQLSSSPTPYYVLPYTYAAPVQMTAVTAHKASHAASSHRTV